MTEVAIQDPGAQDPGSGGGWFGLGTGWIPAFDGYRYVGNGENDLFNYLSEDAWDDGRLTQEELDAAQDRRGLPLNDIDALALAHDRGIIDPETGEYRDTIGQVMNDLGFSWDSLQAFFDNPIENLFGLATAAFGIVAAGYHALVGLTNAVVNAVVAAVNWAVDTFLGFFRPIVLDLDGDGIELVGAESSTATFDFDDDGFAERVGWVSADDGLLVYDADGSGTINSADEVSFVGYLAGAQTDLEGLSAFDADGDGWLTEADAAVGNFDWRNFMIWQDADQDGVSDAGELVTLLDAGVSSINLGLNGDASELAGNLIHNTTSYVRTDGSIGQAADVSFVTNNFGGNRIDVGDLATGWRTDMGLSILIINPDQRGLDVRGTANDDLIFFSEANDAFLITGGDGYDTVFFTGAEQIDDFEIFQISDDGLIGFRSLEHDETFFLSSDVEAINIAGQTFDLTEYWL